MNNLVLTGMMGTGKSTVGRLVARRLGLCFADSDVEIERRAGRSLAALVAAEDEAGFRALECEVVADLLRSDAAVLALGGGALLDQGSRHLAEARGRVVTLSCAVPELLARLEGAERPLLVGGDRRGRLEALLTERASLYARYPGVDTSGRTPDAVAAHVAALHRGGTTPGAWDESPGAGAATTPGATRLRFGPAADGLTRAIAEAAGADPPTAVVVIVDAALSADAVDPLRGVLRDAGLRIHEAPIAGGETAKRLDTAAALYGQLLVAGIDRGAVVVGIGGGVVTDLAGFVASTYLRGLPLILVPSTLLAQVDAAVGGKTAVDLAEAKNVVGTIHAAHTVLVDTTLLATLPAREIRNGLAEMVKLGIILDATLLDSLEELSNAAAVVSHADLIERTARDKLAVVGRDPRDGGERLLLNFGHTVGHAVETASGYATPHGEAVAQGMVVATRLAVDLGLCAPELLDRLRNLLARLGLRTTLDDTEAERLVAAMAHDKKRRGSAQRFVLPTGPGRGVVQAVPPAAVRAALQACAGGGQ